MKIGKISGTDYRFLGVSKKNPSNKKNASPLFVLKMDDATDELYFERKKMPSLRENLPEAGIILSSIFVGSVILYGLLGGKKI